MRYIVTAVLLLYGICPTNGQTPSDLTSVISKFDAIGSVPDTMIFSNSFTFRTAGGHLQGIQSMFFQDRNYFFMTGSSDSASYFLSVKSGKENQVTGVKLILGPPFKHAGGFQISDNLLAVGVEDNNEKNRSKVFIFRIENPDIIPKTPLAMIDRYGTVKRGTAGCTAITVIDDKILLAVGDWDTENIDFYHLDKDRQYEDGTYFEPEYSINMRKTPKESWIDQKVLSYQNINFIQEDQDRLYLAGFAQNQTGENVLDLFLVNPVFPKGYALTKVYSRSFPKNEKTKFKWGAGISFNQKGEPSILSTEENIDSSSVIYIYK